MTAGSYAPRSPHVGLQELAGLLAAAADRAHQVMTRGATAGSPVADGAAQPAFRSMPAERSSSKAVADAATDTRTVSSARPASAVADPEPPDGGDDVWAIMARAQAGDADAFGQLYDRYVTVVYRFIYYRLGDRTQAEDLTSETFVRALRRLSSVKNQGRDPAAWFVTIARNLVLDHVKSARYRLEITTDELLDNETSDSPETAVLTALTNERLLAAVRELSPEQRECIVLRFLQGFSVAETAAVMGKNEGAVKAMQHRAVKRLHELVSEDLR